MFFFAAESPPDYLSVYYQAIAAASKDRLNFK
jgi:hypothetical protein